MSSEEMVETDYALGRWKADEHERFLRALMKHGKEWKRVEDQVETRTGPQVRSHSQKFFLKLSKINKDRRKHKNRDNLRRTQTEDQILRLFDESHITQLTPPQMAAVIRNEVIPYRQPTQPQKPVEQSSPSMKMDQSEDSYFMTLMKYNPRYFTAGDMFKELIDIRQQQLDQDTHPPRARGGSFHTYEEDSSRKQQ